MTNRETILFASVRFGAKARRLTFQVSTLHPPSPTSLSVTLESGIETHILQIAAKFGSPSSRKSVSPSGATLKDALDELTRALEYEITLKRIVKEAARRITEGGGRGSDEGGGR